MKKMIKLIVIFFLVFGIMIVLNGTIIYAAYILETVIYENEKLPEQPYIKSVQMQATAYCLNGTTATGTQTRRGIAASKREWFGKTVEIFEADKNGKPVTFIGEYVIEDTGGKAIKNGKVIDIWMETEEECSQFGRKNVVVFLLD